MPESMSSLGESIADDALRGYDVIVLLEVAGPRGVAALCVSQGVPPSDVVA